MPPDQKSAEPKPAAFSKLKSLKCYKIVHQHLVDGWPLTEVARIIQEDHKEYTEVTKSGLVAMLHKYRATIPPVELAQKVLTNDHVAALKKVEEGIDELEELTKLYRIQMDRVNLDLTLEKNMKKMLTTTGQEVRIAREILDTISELKMDLGLNNRHLGKTETHTTQILLNADISPDARKVLDNPDGRRKLLGVAQRLLASAGNIKEPIPVTASRSEPAPDPVAHVFTDKDKP